MAIYYGHEENGSGGFVVGDTRTGMTAYAYRASVSWKLAFKHPESVARELIRRESMYCRNLPNVRDYDQRNWAKLATIVL